MLCKTLWLYNAGISKEIMRTVVIAQQQHNGTFLTEQPYLTGYKIHFPPPPSTTYLWLFIGGETCIKGSTFPNPEGSSAVPMHTVKFWSMALVT